MRGHNKTARRSTWQDQGPPQLCKPAMSQVPSSQKRIAWAGPQSGYGDRPHRMQRAKMSAAQSCLTQALWEKQSYQNLCGIISRECSAWACTNLCNGVFTGCTVAQEWSRTCWEPKQLSSSMCPGRGRPEAQMHTIGASHCWEQSTTARDSTLLDKHEEPL